MAFIDNVVRFNVVSLEIFLERETMQAIRTASMMQGDDAGRRCRRCMTPRMSTATGAMDLIQGYFHAEKCQ